MPDLEDYFRRAQAAQEGTELHELAATLIKKGIKLPRSQKTLNMYVNDAIGFRMTPEQVLCYSYNVFGTVDAISFKGDLLRIHDLKTGTSRASMRQLEIYASLFCLEYGIKPGLIQIELRIYKMDEIEIYIPEVDVIAHIMDKIMIFDKHLQRLQEEATA